MNEPIRPRMHSEDYWAAQKLFEKIHGGADALKLRAREIGSITASYTPDKAQQFANRFRRRLIEPETKRLMVSAAQAKVLYQDTLLRTSVVRGNRILGARPQNFRTIAPDLGQQYLPFPQFIMMFDEPIAINDQMEVIDGAATTDKIIAMFYAEERTEQPTLNSLICLTEHAFKHDEITGRQAATGIGWMVLNVDASLRTYCDRSQMANDLAINVSGVNPSARLDQFDAMVDEVPDARDRMMTLFGSVNQPSQLPAGEGSEMLMCGDVYPDMPRRLIGGHEAAGLVVGDFFRLLMVYVMSRSIVIESLAPPRNVTRRAARKGYIPEPWYIVKVAPRYRQVTPTDDDGQRSRAHSYRYDVIGHIRRQRRRQKDGSYRETIEFVRGHQRGLKNALYVPSTHKIEGAVNASI